jgi:hypothetical protein
MDLAAFAWRASPTGTRRALHPSGPDFSFLLCFLKAMSACYGCAFAVAVLGSVRVLFDAFVSVLIVAEVGAWTAACAAHAGRFIAVARRGFCFCFFAVCRAIW